MVIVISEHIPNAIRGKMKLWFVEVKPNVFVSGINDHVAKKVVDYLFSKSTFLSGMTIVISQKKAPGYKILSIGTTQNKIVDVSGLQLITKRQT